MVLFDAFIATRFIVAQLEPNMELLTSILALNNLPAKAMENARL